ncbi:8333_t:CDS:2, partial [Dentiscutata erythropus]
MTPNLIFLNIYNYWALRSRKIRSIHPHYEKRQKELQQLLVTWLIADSHPLIIVQRETAEYLVNCISDCRTQWNSSYLAWIQLVQIKIYIELLIIYLTSHDNSNDQLLQVLGPFEESYALGCKRIENIFKSNQVNEDESYNIEDYNAFDDYEKEESKMNNLELKSVFALLDPHLKSLDYMDNMNRIAVKNFFRQLYDNEKTVEIDQNEKELDDNNQNLEKQVSDEFIVIANPLYILYLLKSLEKEDCPIDNEIDKYMRQPEI